MPLRPFAMVSPTQDEDMPRAGVDAPLPVVREGYAAAGCEERFANPKAIIGHPRGFHPVRQATLEVFGRGPRWLRAPEPSLDDGEVKELREIIEKMDLLT